MTTRPAASPTLELHRHPTADSFLAEAGAFLAAREAEHNLLLGVGAMLRDHPEIGGHAPYFATVIAGGDVQLVALRTPPLNLVLSEAAGADSMAGSIDLLVHDVAGMGTELPGVIGPSAVASSFATAWAERAGQRAVPAMAERIFRLTRVIDPPAPPGSWRAADERDRRLLGEWIVAFEREALPDEPPRADLDAFVDRWIERVGRMMYLWVVGGRLVSMVGVGSPTPNGIRIGPVYTPPQERGHGYASALTAAASRDQLAAGRSFCFLYTDLANPTSNRIYQAIGYEPVADASVYRFVAGRGG